MARQIKAGEASAAKRRLYWQVVGADGISPALGEAGGQPQVSIDGGAWAGAGSVGALSHVGDGRYYAELDPSAVASAGAWVESRYKSGATAECPGDSALVVSYDPATTQGEVLARLNAAGLTVTVSSPVPADGGAVRLVSGDDYLAADGRALVWHLVTTLNLSGAAILLSVYGGPRESDGVAATSAVSATPVTGGYDLAAELTATQTALMAPRFAPREQPLRRYEVVAVLADASVVTLAEGTVWVTE